MTTRLSFASFNLYNFQKAGSKVYSNTVSASLYDKKLNWTRERLIDIDTDIIAFQELWARECLDDVFNTPPLSNYQLVYIKDDSAWYGIAVAIAVRKPWSIKSKELIKSFPFDALCKIDEGDGEDDEVDLRIKKFSRTIIKATISHPLVTLPDFTIFVAHFKAKLPTRVSSISSVHRSAIGSAISTIRRTAEAAALRWLLTNHMKGNNNPTVVIGDLNDDPRSNTLALLTQQPNQLINARGSDTSLYSTLQLQQLKSYRDVFYTHNYHNSKDTIDHILVSEELFEPSNKAIAKHIETRVWNDYIDDDHVHTSDHGIIKASFKL